MIEGLETVEGIISIVEKKPVTFIHGDNMEFLRYCYRNMMYKHFHVGIVDPPYAIEVGKMNLGATKDTVRNYEMGDWDKNVPTLEYWFLLNYVCRELIIWGGNYFTDSFGSGYEVELKDGKLIYVYDLTSLDKTKIAKVTFFEGVRAGRCFVVWDKQNDKMSFAGGELALTTFDRNAIIMRRPRNAKSIDNEGERRHPTQKPVYLYDFLHMEFVEKNQRILDTHGGSHTHAIAASKNNLSLTIIEKQLSYHLDGIKAYENASSAPRLLF